VAQPLRTPLLNLGANPINPAYPAYLDYHRRRREHQS
jgi:hypothetical protein